MTSIFYCTWKFSKLLFLSCILTSILLSILSKKFLFSGGHPRPGSTKMLHFIILDMRIRINILLPNNSRLMNPFIHLSCMIKKNLISWLPTLYSPWTLLLLNSNFIFPNWTLLTFLNSNIFFILINFINFLINQNFCFYLLGL